MSWYRRRTVPGFPAHGQAGFVSNSHFGERGGVGDQPQRANWAEGSSLLNLLRLVEDDTAALRCKMRIAADSSSWAT